MTFNRPKITSIEPVFNTTVMAKLEIDGKWTRTQTVSNCYREACHWHSRKAVGAKYYFFRMVRRALTELMDTHSLASRWVLPESPVSPYLLEFSRFNEPVILTGDLWIVVNSLRIKEVLDSCVDIRPLPEGKLDELKAAVQDVTEDELFNYKLKLLHHASEEVFSGIDT